jgi:hypothetical protein
MYVIHAIRRTFHVPIWELAQRLGCVFRWFAYGNRRDRAVPILGWRVIPSAGAQRCLLFSLSVNGGIL